jgi:hypothetical protein
MLWRWATVQAGRSREELQKTLTTQPAGIAFIEMGPVYLQDCVLL